MGLASPAAAPEHELLALRSGVGRVALVATVVASSSAMLDATVVNVALPRIGHDLDAGVSGLQWVVTAYLLTLASFILLGGALGDRFGRRRIFRIGAVWFAVASLMCAVAPGLTFLVIARMLQGAGGALLTPTSLALTQASFAARDRAAAVGMWSGLGGIAGALGPLIGGWLVDGPGWRWAFLLNLPMLAIALGASGVLPESRGLRGNGRFDFLGAVFAAFTFGGLTWALTEAPRRGWGDAAVLAAVTFALVSALAFFGHERRTDAPLVPGLLFRSRTFTALNVATFALYATIGAQFFLLVYQLQVSAGWSAVAAGSALLPATALMLVGSARSGELSARIGPRLQLVVGPLLVAAGQLLLARVNRDAAWVGDVLPGALLFGVGLVTFVAPLTASVMGSVDESYVSTASGVNNAIARTGTLFAIALIPSVSGLTTAAGPVATTDAYRTGMLIAAGLAVVASIVSAVGLRRAVRTRDSARRYECPVDGAPMQPDPRICPPRARPKNSG